MHSLALIITIMIMIINTGLYIFYIFIYQDEENMNLKERYRTEVRQELKKLEIICVNMASLLRGLGIHVGDSPVPSSNEVGCILL